MTASDHLEYTLRRLKMEPNDVLVVRCTKSISNEASRRLHKAARNILGENAKVLVVDPELDISILTAAEIETRSTQSEGEERVA